MKRNRHYDELLSVFKKILLQCCTSAHKIYSIHEPDVQCISKGKEHKKYEFGNKVSIIHSTTVSFLVPVLSATNTMNTQYRRAWNRCSGCQKRASSDWQETEDIATRKR